MVLVCYFSDDVDVELIHHLDIFFSQIFVQIFCPFKNWVVHFLY